jgi:hypothetical protein
VPLPSPSTWLNLAPKAMGQRTPSDP